MTNQIHVAGTRKSFLFASAGLATLLSACSGGGDSGGGAATALAYSGDGFVYLTGVVAPSLEPVSAPAGAAAFSVAPALPAGLTLDPTTGVISGEPSALAPPTVYTVSAGGASTTLELEVRERFDAPRFAYTLDWDASRVRTWRVDARTGALEAAGSTGADLFPFRAVSDPLGRFLYVSHFGTGTLGVFRIDGATGELTPVQLLPVGTAAFELEMSPNGRFLVAGDVGADVVIGFTIDPDTGHVTPAPGAVTLPDPSGLAINADGDRLFAASLSAGSITSYALDRDTGAILGQVDVESTPGPVGLALAPDGSALFTANSGLDAITTFLVDGQSGALNRLTSIFSGEEPVAITVDDAGSRLAVASLGGRRIESFDIGADRSLTLIDTIDLDGSAVNLVELGVGGTLLAPLFDEQLVSSALPGSTAGSFVPGPVHPTLGRTSDLAVVFAARGATLDPRFAYAANLGAGDVVPLGWDAAAERLDPIGPSVPTGGKPSGLDLSADGELLFVADQLDEAVLPLERDLGTGLLAQPAGAVPAGPLTRALAVGPDGTQLLALTNDGLTCFALGADGSLTETTSAAAGLTPDDLTIAPDGRHVFVANQGSGDLSVFALTDSGLVEVPGSPFADGGTSSPRAVAISPDGRLLAVASADDDRVRIYAVDRASGALTQHQDLVLGQEPRDVVWSLDGRTLYAALFRDNAVATVGRTDDDTLVLRGTIVSGQGPLALHLDGSGELLLAAGFESDTVEVLAVDADGTLTRLDSMPAGTGAGPAALASRPVWVELD